MTAEDYLLHLDVIRSVPFGSSLTARLLQHRISETFVDDSNNDPGVSVVVRAFNEASQLERLFEDIRNQKFSSPVEVVVVDNGSTDRTSHVAKYHGAEVVTLSQSEFTYPKSLNLGVEAASNDLVFVTVAHTNLSNIYSLHAGARHFSKDANTAGAFGRNLPNEGASYIERWSAPTYVNPFLARSARPLKKAYHGILSAFGAMIAKPVWQELGRFDERYQHGGEDEALAILMLKNGYGIVEEPALSVHHSHGLGAVDYWKQLGHYRQVRKPKQFDRQELLRRRPDLRANGSTLDP